MANNEWVNKTTELFTQMDTGLNQQIHTLSKDNDGYNVYHTDRPKKGGGVAIYVTLWFHVKVVLSESICKKLEFLAVNVEIAKGLFITVLWASVCLQRALQSMMHLLSIKL